MKNALPKKILVTSALPYANGSIHLGHLVEYLQSDIWVRTQKALGHQCIYVCADDAHGTAIMVRAEKEGITPEQLIDRVKKEHEADFRDFLIEFDAYHSTHSEENKTLALEIFSENKKNGKIIEKNVTQLYDPEKQMFLADRFVKGSCPKCKAEDQYGDNCEVCGSTYPAKDLINPKSVYSGAKPIEKDALQLFFDLPQFKDMLGTWLESGSLQEEIANKLKEWYQMGLKPWDISREAPYFGFEIPGYPNKYLYVWMDAPVGYMASFKHLCKQNKALDFDEYWRPDSSAEVYHFIGKDIINFHGLFWPAMLTGANFRTPTALFVHGFLTVNGQKMSKSRGTFIKARTYLDHLNPEYLRYYFAAKLNSKVEDLDLNLEDFVQRVNADLVNKFVNIASRCARFINKNFDSQLADSMTNPGFYQSAVESGQQIFEAFTAREYSKAIRDIMQIADQVNQIIDEEKPWVKIKDADMQKDVQQTCTLGINIFRVLMTYLAPVLPETAKKAAEFLSLDPAAQWTLENIRQPLLNHQIADFQPLMQRIDQKKIQALVNDSVEAQTTDKNSNTAHSPKPKEKQSKNAQPAGVISMDDLNKIDLRIGKIISAEPVEGADKLLKLEVDIGDKNNQKTKTRTIFAGIKSAYDPVNLVGKLTLVVANLAPRKMRFGLSEGMLLAAGPGGENIFLLSPDSHGTNDEPLRNALPGMQVQ